MDHLPRPSTRNDRGRGFQRECTRLLANLHNDHSKSSFHEYPQSLGVTGVLSEVFGTECQVTSEVASRDVAVIQNWLFFGLLEEVLRKPIQTRDWTEVEGPNTYLSTRCLEDWMTQWKTEVESCEDIAKQTWKADASKALITASSFFRIVSPNFESSNWKPFRQYLVPLAVLADTIHSKFYNVFGPLVREPEIILADSTYVRTLAQRGWCPHVVSTSLTGITSPSFREYINSFRDHPSFLSRDHTSCTEQVCIASNVDLVAYKVHHICENSDCEIVKPDLRLIREALDSGTFPVVVFSKARNIFHTLKHPPPGYFAISHVWADGLGSSSEIGLPICRLIDLANMLTDACRGEDLDDLRGDLSPPFWIDSICIPSEPTLRKTAINRMADVYREARAVMVLDKGIQQIRTDDPPQEQLLAIYVSGWSQRLWTFEEAFLAKMILLRTSNGNIDFERLTSRALLQPNMNKLLWMLTCGEFFIAKKERPTLGLVSRQLALRTSSKTSDETLALLGLFDLDATGYHDLNAEDRMIKFLREHDGGNMHKNIIFFKGEKLEHPPFTWAPRTFMSRPREGILPLTDRTNADMAFINDDGLCGRWECFVPESPWSSEYAPLRFVLHLEGLPEGIAFGTPGNQPEVSLKDRTGEQVYVLRAPEGNPVPPQEGQPIMAVRIVERVRFPDGLSFAIAEAKYELTIATTAPNLIQKYYKDDPRRNATFQRLFLLFR